MPRTLSAGMETHVNQSVTQLAHIWTIRRRDTVTYRFTSLDRNLTYDGNVYYALQAGSQSAIEFRLELSVNNLEIRGFLDQLHISEADLIAGRFDRADVRFFIVKWEIVNGRSVVVETPVKTIRGWTGAVTREGNVYTAEVRSLSQALQQSIGSVISERCRALPLGSTGFGADRGCNYPIDPDPWAAYTEYGTPPSGSGAVIIALPNGHGDWDAGAPANGTVYIQSGGIGYSNNLEISAHWTFDWGEVIKWDATSYTVTDGVITDVFFPLTSDEQGKPGHSAVSISVVDLGGIDDTFVAPTTPNGFNYRLIQTGQTDSVEPTWPTTIGATVTDGSVVWEAVASSRYAGTVAFSDVRWYIEVDGASIPGDPDFTASNSILGTGAVLNALPNGNGLWDGGISPINVQIVNGGLNYQQPSAKAIFIHPQNGTTVEWVATTVGVSTEGKITYVSFPPTIENEKPDSAAVTFVITDETGIDSEAPGGFFDGGSVLFTSGENIGLEIDILRFSDQGGGYYAIELAAPAPFDITYGVSDGTGVLLKIGCDGRWQTCKNRFHNQLNFRGEPGIPGTDVLFRINTNE